MKLFHAPDGVVDRYDRCVWLTDPFDLKFVVIRQTNPDEYIRRSPSLADSVVRHSPSEPSTHVRRWTQTSDAIRR
jgi:hypothetical protein